ncbi:MAG: thioether cross-link-forming SCIFF peptide maturase [Firmicutes bacterium]|nr:thioether cross-link-forming SCIFF peptide maturase [Bacillota bacterium]
MIHLFKINEINIIVDVNSGAVHCVDNIVYDILRLCDNKPPAKCPEKTLNTLAGEYSKDEILSAYDEILDLCAMGMLYTDDEYEHIAASTEKKTVVKALCLHVSHDCNMRCGYCFAGTGNFSGERCVMSAQTGKKAIDFVIEKSASRKNIELDFFGGEPLMNFDVVKELVYYAKEQEKKYDKNFRLTITTNGVLLDEEKLNFINEHMYNLVLSIDGRKSVNDKMRKLVNGNGSYDVIMPKLKAAANSRNQDNYYVRGTFTRNNLDFCNDVLHLADCGFEQISIEPVVGGENEPYSIKKEDLPYIFGQYERLAKEYVSRRADGRWFNFFHFMVDLEQGPCVIKRISGCGAGCEYLAVTPEGDIYPCHQFVGNKDFLMGNVYNNDFDGKSAQSFAKANIYTKEKCKGCWAKFYCSGGCHANAYSFGKDILTPYEIGCEMEKKRIECALYIKAMESN